ncbi:GPP34 family phosphoprotein [Nonomuraea sp. NPDC050404]|uniref:GOLPH3/VPS74 family protein n=1 Tax=Nonomuraea sp. NPDC050404 TaxID=3155783 RepID=UPI0033C8974F
MSSLPLHQDLYLIAHDQAGKPLVHASSLAVGLAGAALLDLLLAGHVKVGSAGLTAEGQAIGDAVADGLLAMAAAGPDPRSLLKQASMGDVYGRVREGLLGSGVLVRVSRRRMGMLPYTRYELADIASIVRASSGVRSAVEGWKTPDARCAGLCGLVAVLRLESQLYLDQPAARLVTRLREIAAAAAPPVGRLVETVDTLVGEAAVAVYR